MAMTRSINPSIFFDEELAELPMAARYLFIGLWCLADREGRLEDRPRRIAAQIFPYEELDVDELLKKLDGAGFIVRYEVEGKRYIQVENFHRYQSPHRKERESEIPAPRKKTRKRSPRALMPDLSAADLIEQQFDIEKIGTEQARELAYLLREKILENLPSAKVPKTPEAMASWIKDIDRMLRIDGRSPPEARRVIEFATSDSFWMANILSARKLREKYDQLFIKMDRSECESRKSGEDFDGTSKPGKYASSGIYRGG